MFWSKPVTLWLFLSKVTLSLKGNTESVIFLVAFSAARWKENNFWVSQCYLPKIRSWCRSATCFTGESWVSVLLWKSELKVLQCYQCHRETMQYRVTCIESHFGLVSLSTPYIFDIDMSHDNFFFWFKPSFLKNPRTWKNICLKHKKETEREIVKTVWSFDEKVQDMDMRIYF